MKGMSGNRTSSPVIKRLKRQCAAHACQRNVHRGKLKRLGSPFILKTVPPFLKDVRFLIGALREKIRNWVTVRSFRSVPILGDTYISSRCRNA